MVYLSDEEESSCDSHDMLFRGPLRSQSVVFEELVFRIEALLTSRWKGDPSWCFLVSIYSKCKHQVYKVQDFTKLNDALGD